MVAFDHSHQEMRHYRVDKMRKVELLPDTEGEQKRGLAGFVASLKSIRVKKND